MLLDLIQDAGFPIHGDGSKVSDRTQDVGTTIMHVLPAMGAPLHVSVSEHVLFLSWYHPRFRFTAKIHEYDVELQLGRDTRSKTLTVDAEDTDVLVLNIASALDFTHNCEAENVRQAT